MHARAEQTLLLDAPVERVRYAHGKRLQGLAALGIYTIRDLLNHLPFRYNDFSEVVRIVNAQLGQHCAVLGRIYETKQRKSAKGTAVYEVTLVDDSGMLKAAWFNQRWLADTLTVGKRLLLLGKIDHFGGYLTMSSPLYEVVAEEVTGGSDPKGLAPANNNARGVETRAAGGVETGVQPVGIAPVYRATAEISSNWIKRLVIEARALVPEPLDPLPPDLRIKRQLVSRQIAWRDIHAPPNKEALAAARRRLAYEQLFWTQLGLAQLDAAELAGRATYSHQAHTGLARRLAEVLPFALTASQQRSVAEISEDMAGPQRMKRLLLGDVGSGKTVVALHALALAATSGWQAAMMAPTEVLARQYAQAMGGFLDALGISFTVLTSSCSASERREALAGLARGAIQIAFGTHALIEPDVEFKELSLIVIDEQHRFGVAHRARLRAKSPAADLLSLTATPIPRSLALVLYGNIQVSTLENRPGKARTTTRQLDASVVYQAYDAVRAALARGEQAYIVCPLISAPPEGDEPHYLDNLESWCDEPAIAAAEAEVSLLKNKLFPDRRIALMTSRLPSAEKQQVMEDFRAGALDILVSTTVIEVGVDVPNATVMIILDAHRFGLAQLHQLRGRVGRGSKDAQVFLVSQKAGKEARRRLGLMERQSDGFALARADLELRQEGDLLGTRQHGTADLTLINVIRDSELIDAARADACELLENDPELAALAHQQLRYELSVASAMPQD